MTHGKEECINQQQLCMKNSVMKPQHKVSQRGPGVAELEKMLTKHTTNHETDDKISSHVYPLLLPKPPQHGFVNDGRYANMGLQKNGSFLPTMLRPAEFNSKGNVPKPQIMNPYSAASSMPSPGFNQLELPLNQISQLCSYASFWHEDDKTIGMKRPWPFSNYPWSRPSFPPCLSMSEQPSTSSNHFVSNYESTNKISRDAKRRCQIEVKSNKCSDENGTFDGNILTLGRKRTPSPSSSLTLKEDSSEVQNHNRIKDDMFHRSRQGGKNKIEKPFYNFLLPKEHMDTTESTLSLRGEKNGRRQTLDLDLKL